VIVEFLVGALVGVFQALVVAVLPASSGLPFAVPTGIIAGYSWLNQIAPLSEALTVGAVAIAALSAVFGFRLLLTIRHLVLP